MSEREFMDLADDWQDGPGDEAASGWDPDLLEDFPDDDPAAQDGASPAPRPRAAKPAPAAEPPAATAAPAAEAPAPRPTVPPRRRRARGGGGALCFLLVLLAGLTLSAGLLTATGAAPESLLDVSGFTDPAAIGDFQRHPVNAFWLAAAVTLLAALMAALAVDRRVRDLRDRAEQDARILEAVCALDPEQPESWQREELQADPDLAAVTSGLLGHYHLQQAKLTRYVDLEGELHRLEKAMAEGDRSELDGTWENPSAGSLADQALRLLSVSEEAHLDTSERLQAVERQGPDLVTGLRDARTWNTSTQEQLNQQGTAAERLARRVGKLVEQLPADDQRDRQRDRMRQALIAVQNELTSLPARAERRRDEASPVATLVERASRLAFQIAMEVARLGAKGERLLPLTQDLEELTTELRRTTDGADHGSDDDPRDRALESVRGRLAELDPAALDGPSEGTVATAMRELAPMTSQAAAGLAQISRTFGVQTARLGELLDLAGDLTGVDTGGAGDPNAAVGSGLAVDRFDPFGTATTPESGLVADPFAQTGGSIFDVGGDGGEFAQTALPGEETAASPEPSGEPAAAAPDPFQSPAPGPSSDATAAGSPAASLGDLGAAPRENLVDLAGPPAEASGVPPSDEKVYDLAEFDAVRLPAEADADGGEPIHDLREFGAERIG